jgi:hypothetical protein
VLLVISFGGFQAFGDEIDVPLGGPIPDGDFFWNACRT